MTYIGNLNKKIFVSKSWAHFFSDKEGEWRNKRVTVYEAVGSLIQQLRETSDVKKKQLFYSINLSVISFVER